MPTTSFPTDATAWPEFLATTVDARLEHARALVARLKDGAPRTTAEVLDLWNDADVAIGTASSAAHLLAEVHPDADLRVAAEERAQAAEDLVTERGLDHELWQVLAATDPDGLEPGALRVRDRVLRDFRRAGVDRSPEDRDRLRALAQRCTELGLEFSRNIRDDVRSIRVPPEQLDGLPDDFRAEHAPDEDGLVTLTTEYPDLLPVRTYATDPAVRLALTREHQLIGWPANEPILAELLRLRAERATLLGYADWPTYDAEVKMIGSGSAIADLVERLDGLTAERAAHDVDVMLARYRQDVPGATAVTAADNLYYDQIIKNEQYDVDFREVREYFRYEAVKPGVLDVVSRLFGIALERVDAPTWHPDVEVYDVTDAGRAIGRVYLDMHPRAGKFNHAAQFPLVPGIAGRSLPEGTLVCNFPTGLMEHDDVLTFFHELGHLVHEVLGGHQPWAMFTGVATEWDFVEAPSQLLEEWGWDAGVLGSFATNADGEPIPAALVERMRRADAFGRGAWTRRQLNYTALSYGLHADPPADLATYTADVDARFGPYTPIPETHQYAGFGHLDGYGSAYYTYLWSLVIAKDLRTAFTDGLMDPVVGRRYRDAILAPGGSADAAELVQRFLGRPSSFDAFEAWLAEGTV
ncbi:M3 family metallopeptidase [Cellulomonas sp.]|uniref:M3 family metallopeptidase n=1 Tax=Cellulomonas sp. TaxID=40001 RepID=UPI003BAA1A41